MQKIIDKFWISYIFSTSAWLSSISRTNVSKSGAFSTSSTIRTEEGMSLTVQVVGTSSQGMIV